MGSCCNTSDKDKKGNMVIPDNTDDQVLEKKAEIYKVPDMMYTDSGIQKVAKVTDSRENLD